MFRVSFFREFRYGKLSEEKRLEKCMSPSSSSFSIYSKRFTLLVYDVIAYIIFYIITGMLLQNALLVFCLLLLFLCSPLSLVFFFFFLFAIFSCLPPVALFVGYLFYFVCLKLFILSGICFITSVFTCCLLVRHFYFYKLISLL